MRNIVVNAAALGAVADSVEHEIMMMNLSDDETAADDWSFSGPRIRDAVDNLRNIIKTAPAAPAPGKDVINLSRDASEDILNAGADPAADAGSRFRQGKAAKVSLSGYAGTNNETNYTASGLIGGSMNGR